MAAQSAAAADSPPSLAEKRLNIIRGNAPGIVLLDLPKEQPAVPAPVAPPRAPATQGGTANAAAVAPSDATKPAEVANPSPPVLNRLFSAMPAPVGRPLRDARRLDAPDQGVPLPVAGSAGQTAPPASPAH